MMDVDLDEEACVIPLPMSPLISSTPYRSWKNLSGPTYCSPSPPSVTNRRVLKARRSLANSNSRLSIKTISFSPSQSPLASSLPFSPSPPPSTFRKIINTNPAPNHARLKSRLFTKRSGVEDLTSSDIASPLPPPVKEANINPFTEPDSRRRKHSLHSSNMECSLEECGEVVDLECSSQPGKKVKVTDLNVSRYSEEFLELRQLASGQFGSVHLARHRLDGVEYAVKVSRTDLSRATSYQRAKALVEVFASAAMLHHKNIVRYYSSWVERGQLYIQTEFCMGGSLDRRIQAKRGKEGRRFTEQYLKRVLADILSGLAYMHSKGLAHLDIKPENILVTTEDEGEEGVVGYKVGDLGHSSPMGGSEADQCQEEGDCRYMAPELLEMQVDQTRLDKADVFSLGLGVFEMASLRVLPRNSEEDPKYEDIKKGRLEYLPQYISFLNNLLKTMVNPDPSLRPSAAELLSLHFPAHNNDKSCLLLRQERDTLGEELKTAKEELDRTKEKVEELEKRLLRLEGS